MSTPEDAAAHQALADRLKEARRTLGLTQADVTEATGIARSGVSAMESGHRGVTAIEIGRLAQLYRRSVEWLLGDETSPTDDPALLKAVAPLSPKDRELLLSYARFLKSQKGRHA
jgi:transcriptional regulator with XRE-family HTH domain